AELADGERGVETPAAAPRGGGEARAHGGRIYERWRPVASCAGGTPSDRVYLLDRASGTVTFAPALDLRTEHATGLTTLAAVPPAGRQVRLWYRVGGGPGGNVAAGVLTGLRTPIAGVRVEDRQPARGGRSKVPLDAAVRRGPYEFFSGHRAVTARDFELLAIAGSASIARSKAFTRTRMWSYARPGEVEVVLVP